VTVHGIEGTRYRWFNGTASTIHWVEDGLDISVTGEMQGPPTFTHEDELLRIAEGVDASVGEPAPAAEEPPDEPPVDRWGSLAVVDRAPNREEALLTGILDIGEDCVTLLSGNRVVPLIWPSRGTSWDPETQVITYDSGQGAAALSDGDEVAFAGGFSGQRVEARDWIASVDDWVSEPDPSCVDGGARWFVGALTEVTSPGG